MPNYVIFYACALLAGALWWLTFPQNSRRQALRPVLGVVVSALACWMWGISEPAVIFSDFNVAYYPAGRAVLEDLPHLFRRCWDTPVCGFVNIPIVAFLFTPFSILTLTHAQWLLVGLSAISLVLGVGLLHSITDRAPARMWAILLLFAMNGPLMYSLKEGNLTHFTLLLLIVGVVCLDRSWERRAGACFALAAIIKLPLLLFAVYFLGKRRWAVVFGFGVTLVAVTALSLWYAGWAGHVEWYREVIMPFSNKGLTAFNVQSIEGVLLRLQDDAKLYDWRPVEVSTEIKVTGQACAALLVGLSSLLFLRSPGRPSRDTLYLELSMVLCLALIISPISWTHYYLLLLLPLSLYAGNRLPVPRQGGWLGMMILCLLLISPPVTFTGQDGLPQGFLGTLLLSHYLIGAVLLWGLLGYARWLVADQQQLRLVSARRERRRPLQVNGAGDHDESDERPVKDAAAS